MAPRRQRSSPLVEYSGSRGNAPAAGSAVRHEFVRAQMRRRFPRSPVPLARPFQLMNSRVAAGQRGRNNGGVHFGSSAFVLFAAMACPCLAEGVLFPPLNGQFSGEISPLGPQQPSLHWSAAATSSETGDRRISLVVEGAGASAKAEAQLASAEPSGTWELQAAKVDLRLWWTALAGKLFPSSAAMVVAGNLSCVGRGQIEDSGVSGELQLELKTGSFSDSALGWSIDGVDAALLLVRFSALASAPQQKLTFTTLKMADFVISGGAVEYQLESKTRIRVYGAKFDQLGGTVVVGGFVFDLQKMEIETSVKLNGVELSALQPYLPKTVIEAHGKVDGQFVLHWTQKDGLQVGDGRLQLRPGEPASIRLASAPGFLSSHVPERINLLPPWMGPIARSASKAFKAHQTLESIESGKEMLVIDSVQVELHGASPARDEGAVVKLVAHPTSVDAVKAVRLNVNLTGPIADVLRYGMRGELSLGTE